MGPRVRVRVRVFNVRVRASGPHRHRHPDPNPNPNSPKAGFILELVAAFKSGRVSAAKLAAASDREAMRMLCSLKVGEI